MTTDSNEAAAAPQENDQPVPQRRASAGMRRWLAWGTGIAVEIRDSDLLVTAVRVRPSEAGILGSTVVTDYRSRPAAEWGTELLSFLRKAGAGHIAATVLLPRRDVIVRQIHLPGVSGRDLPSAIQLQMDALHPFADEDVYFSQARIRNTPYVLVGIVRRETLDAYYSLFSEAGIKVQSFTFSAAALYSASRLITEPPSDFVAVHPVAGGVELYGESEARPLYSATLPVSADRAAALARAELRLEPDAPALSIPELLPKPAAFPPDQDPDNPEQEGRALAYATALAGACPSLGIEGNLLPADRRRGSSRIRLIPTFTLAGTLSVLLVLLAVQSTWADKRYLDVIQHEIRKYEPRARRVEELDKATASARARSQSLDDFRRRAKLDMDALAEITKLIPPPGWAASLELNRDTLQLAGEADQAAALLKTIDSSPLFAASEFTMPITKSQAGAEMFRIRARRETPPLPAPAKPQGANTAAAGGTK